MRWGELANSCAGTRTCSNGRCLDVDVDNTAASNEFHPQARVGETLAQTFEATRAGNLNEIRVGWFCDGYTTSLQRVGADGMPSASAESIDIDVRSGGAVNLGVSVLVEPPLAVTPGERLALLFSPTDVGVRTYCLAYASSGDRYPDGQLLLSSNGRWTPLEGDMNFKFIVAR